MSLSGQINPTSGPHQAASQCQTAQAEDACLLPKSAEARIAAGLKQFYSHMLADPMPDKFTILLQQLSGILSTPEGEP
jgi:hypothetical protein